MDIIKKKMENDIQKKILSEVRKLKEEIAEFQKKQYEREVDIEATNLLNSITRIKDAFPNTRLKDGDMMYDVFAHYDIVSLGDLSKKTREWLFDFTRSYKTVYDIEEVLESYGMRLKSKYEDQNNL